MAGIDAYSPCPCGSGQKFKWCCHNVESYAERAARLHTGGQPAGAIEAVDEGLRKVPGSPWLSIRKAVYLIQEQKFDEARQVLEPMLALHRGHPVAHALLTQVVLNTQGPVHAVERLQRALMDVPVESRKSLDAVAQVVGGVLLQAGFVPAARAHLELALALGGADGPRAILARSALDSASRNEAGSLWLRNPYTLLAAPERLQDRSRARFDEALKWAGQGLWTTAAAAFEALSGDRLREADHNLGVCRIWLADHAGAVPPLRRYIASLGETSEAVDLEALCQAITPPRADDLVDKVHLIWTLRDHDALSRSLRESDRIHFAGRAPLEPENAQSFEVDEYEVLDRPRPLAGRPLTVESLPLIVGRVYLASETVILEAYDDGRLDDLTAWLRALAGRAIPPAHPRTKEIDKATRVELATRVEPFLPEDEPVEGKDELLRLLSASILLDRWANTPMPFLRDRTPTRAARDGDARVPLRSALWQLEVMQAADGLDEPVAELRRRFELPPEPELDPREVDVERVHLSRLGRIAPEALDDQRLLQLYLRARTFFHIAAIDRSARAIADRESLHGRSDVPWVSVFGDLANLALEDGEPARAYAWLEQGRKIDPASRRAHALRWDLVEVQLKARGETPETWVPLLAALLDRYRGDDAASRTILLTLVEMGIVRTAPHPTDPGKMMIDTRILNALLVEYGPRITTAAGGVPASAGPSGLWTPDAAGAGAGTTTPGGIWTPGGTGAGGPDKPKLIIPGR
jgi:tetratricopeptide (TPR) repeat protein